MGIPSDYLEFGKSLSDIGDSSHAWGSYDIQKVLKFLKENHYIVLGGDVYKISDNNTEITADITGDGWYYNINNEMEWQGQVIESVEKAKKYISEYVRKNGEGFIYSLVFTDSPIE